MNLPKNLITVLIPTYNVEKYIKECLGSVLNQTFQDFDVLIIDDASTDNTVKVIQEINDYRIKILVKKENKGLIDSLNIGFKACKGKYIARVDGDDVNALDRFEKQFNFLEVNADIDACGSWLQCFGSSNRLMKHKETNEEIMCAMFKTAPISIGATMFRREAYKEFSFDSKMSHVEDYDFWARTGFINKMHNLQEVLYFYRIHENQVCQKFRPLQLENKLKIKLLLWKKLCFDNTIYSDDFLSNMLQGHGVYQYKDFLMFKNWGNDILTLNRKLALYNPRLLKLTRAEIVNDILVNTYVRNRRGVGNRDRIKLLFIIPMKWKIVAPFLMVSSKLIFFINRFIKAIDS